MSLYKRKFKPLKTPSYILRIFTIIIFMFTIFLLSTTFFTIQFRVETDWDAKATQEDIDAAVTNLETAKTGIVLLDDAEEDEEEETLAMETMSRTWYYTNVEDDVDLDELLELLDECMDILQDDDLYTEDSYDTLKTEVLNVQYMLGTGLIASQTALQMVFCGNVAQQYVDSDTVSTGGLIYILFIVLPALGFFFNIFDRRRHLKNAATLLCSSLGIFIIMYCITPSYLAIGSLLSIFAYMLLLVLGIASIYAKQQEDYIVKHPELEAEFTEKHPQFVKALLNAKRTNLSASTAKADSPAKNDKGGSKTKKN